MITISSDDLKYSREFYLQSPTYLTGLFVFLLVTLFSGLVLWAWFAKIENTAEGQVIIRPGTPISILKSPVHGSITDIAIQDLEKVTQGQVLILLDSREVEDRIYFLQYTLMHHAQQVRVWEELLHWIQTNTYPSEPSPGFSEKMNTIVSKQNTFDTTYRSMYWELEQELQKPIALQRQNHMTTIELSLKQQVAAYEQWKTQTIQDLGNEIVSGLFQIRHIEYELLIAEAEQKKYTILAPISGTLHLIKPLEKNTRIDLHEILGEIIPLDTEQVKIRIELPTRETSTLILGMTARIHLPAFPPQEYGYLLATITKLPGDGEYREGVGTFFRIEGEIQSWQKNNPLQSNKIPPPLLRPGYTGTAKIIISETRVLDYILRVLDWKQSSG